MKAPLNKKLVEQRIAERKEKVQIKMLSRAECIVFLQRLNHIVLKQQYGDAPANAFVCFPDSKNEIELYPTRREKMIQLVQRSFTRR